MVWNGAENRIERLSGHEALALLGKLISIDNWKAEEISITKRVHKIQIPMQPRGRHKKIQPETTGERQSTEEVIDEERVRLPPEAGPELIEIMQTNKQHLQEMAEQEKKRINEAWAQVYEILIKSSRKDETSKFDFKARPVSWEYQREGHWICHRQQIEGRVCLEKHLLYWFCKVQ